MKSLIAVLAIAVSANVHAYSIADSTVLTTALPTVSSASTSGGYPAALQVVEDAVEFNQSGILHPKLEMRVNAIRNADSSISISEAVDMLVERANEIIEENN